MAKLLIDTDIITSLCKDSEKIIFDDGAEDRLVELLNIQTKINNFVEIVKQAIVDNAQKLDKDFTSMVGDKVNMSYRYFGAQYAVEDWSLVQEELLDTKQTLNMDKVKDYLKYHNRLPSGVVEREREKKLVIKVKEK